MARVSKACSSCGNIFYYDDGLFSNKPEYGDGFFSGYICSNCANERKHREREKKNRYREEESQRKYREREEYQELERRQEEKEYRKRQQELEEERRYEDQLREERLNREKIYKQSNPGNYQCPHCLYITLNRNSTICPICHGEINRQYWDNVHKKELIEAEKKKERDRIENEERLRRAKIEEARQSKLAQEQAIQREIAHKKARILLPFRILLHCIVGAIIGIGIGIVLGFLLGLFAALIGALIHGHDIYSNTTFFITATISATISAIKRGLKPYLDYKYKYGYADSLFSRILLSILITGLLIIAGLFVYSKIHAFANNNHSFTPDSLSTTTNMQQSSGISVFTHGIIFITETSAVGGVDVNGKRDISVEERGICWNTIDSPTVNDHKVLDDGTSNCDIKGLTPNTTYYVRAYAIINNDILYGDVQEFATKAMTTVTDYDGNTYKVVTIGNQVWMAENLKVTHYNDGTEIPNVTDNNAWSFIKVGGYCWYNNEKETYGNTYGALYNWYAVNTGKLAPNGWHVPNDDEWKTLEIYLGIAENEINITGRPRGTDEGSKLAGNSSLWGNGSLKANGNFGISGFAGVPGGFRAGMDGIFGYIGTIGNWWSMTECNANMSIDRSVSSHDSGKIGKFWADKRNGYSIRCIKD